VTRAHWQLPPGVSRGAWDYIQSTVIAQEYDQDLKDHPLFQLDVHLVREHLSEITIDPSYASSCVVADFGCGTGRIARELLPLGFRVLNIDLSQHMLQQVRAIDDPRRQSLCLRANMAEPLWLREESIDMALCLFSSLGMIHGRGHRIAFLQSLYRALKPRRLAILHVHNRYHSLFDPGGARWLIKSFCAGLLHRGEFGDRIYAYRGLPAMYLHIYSRRELQLELSSAGFKQIEFLPISAEGDRLLPASYPFPSLRAGGFFALARR
jgi:SAM-dependent methyltransferase